MKCDRASLCSHRDVISSAPFHILFSLTSINFRAPVAHWSYRCCEDKLHVFLQYRKTFRGANTALEFKTMIK